MTFSANDIAKACLVGDNINQHMETISVDVADILQQIAEFDGPGCIPTTKPRSVQDVQILAARCSFRLRSILIDAVEHKPVVSDLKEQVKDLTDEVKDLEEEKTRLEIEVEDLRDRLAAALKASGSP